MAISIKNLCRPLQVDRLSQYDFYGILHRFTHCWVWEDGIQLLLPGGLQLAGSGSLRYYLGNVSTNHVRAQPLAIFGIDHYFYKTFGRTCCASLTGCRERKLPYFQFVT